MNLIFNKNIHDFVHRTIRILDYAYKRDDKKHLRKVILISISIPRSLVGIIRIVWLINYIIK